MKLEKIEPQKNSLTMKVRSFNYLWRAVKDSNLRHLVLEPLSFTDTPDSVVLDTRISPCPNPRCSIRLSVYAFKLGKLALFYADYPVGYSVDKASLVAGILPVSSTASLMYPAWAVCAFNLLVPQDLIASLTGQESVDLERSRTFGVGLVQDDQQSRVVLVAALHLA